MKSKNRMELGAITQHNLNQLKRLNQVIFPVSYNEKFYKEIVDAGELAKLVYFNDIVVGAVCCRIDANDGKKRLYIMTLGCLAPYRRLGLGSLMLSHVFNLCGLFPSIEEIYLHVQISNDGALEFYKRFGFEVVEVTKNYYRRITPADAYVLSKKVTPGEIPSIDSCSNSTSSPIKQLPVIENVVVNGV